MPEVFVVVVWPVPKVTVTPLSAAPEEVIWPEIVKVDAPLFMARDSVAVPVCEASSVTLTVTLLVTAEEEGIPLSTPAGLRLSPEGKPVALQV